MTARISMLLKSRASLKCFGACFIPGRAKDLSAPGTWTLLRSKPGLRGEVGNKPPGHHGTVTGLL